MAIYALTLTWNGKECLSKLYESILKVQKTLSMDFIWYIRDNASTDGTEELVKSWNNQLFVRYFRVNHNLDNFSKCNNFLVDKIKEENKVDYNKDYFLLLNNDITIDEPNSINSMLNLIDKQNVGIVGAKLYYPNSKIIQHGGVAFSQKHGNMPWHIFTGEQDSIYTNQNREFQAVTGAFLLIKTECFANLPFGKMDERYNWAFDDISMCLDVKYRQNKRILYCGKTKISHYESMTLSKNKCNIMYMQSNVQLLKKQWSRTYKLDYFNYINDPSFNLFIG
jgi:GT2 family glycosyltransferase